MNHLTSRQTKLGLISLISILLMTSVGLISYNHSPFSSPIQDTFHSQVIGLVDESKITPLNCFEITQILTVSNDTVIIDYPNDSTRQPLFGKPKSLSNDNRTLICESVTGEVFSLTYFFDPSDTTGVSPVLMLKRKSSGPMYFLSHSAKCEKLKKYLAN